LPVVRSLLRTCSRTDVTKWSEGLFIVVAVWLGRFDANLLQQLGLIATDGRAASGSSFHLNDFNRDSIGSFDHGCPRVAPGVNLFEELYPFAF
jgi:hypothetical protein